MKNSGKVQIPVIDQDAYNLFDFPNLTGTAERNLLMAVLERAIRDYVGNSESESQSAEEWLFGDYGEAPHDLFSFPWICSQLDLEPSKVVATVSSMPKRGDHRTAPWYFMKAS